MSVTPPALYCSRCGHAILRRVPAGDSRSRDCCDACGTIHYVNPRLVVGTIPVWEDRVLLCRRAIEPRLGLWTLPAGFLEVGESTVEGAARETLEEAGARIEMGEFFSLIDVPYIEQVHLFFRARLLDTDFAPGEESLEVRLFTESDIPWQALAFRTVATTLRLYFADRAAGQFGLHVQAITAPMPTVPAPHAPA